MNDLLPLEAIFFSALERGSEHERAAYLDEACAGDPDLRRRVEKMLTAQAQAASFLEQPAATFDTTVDEPVPERPGTVVGSYKLLEQIGEGGFGIVFMAEQTQPVRRKVALKVLKPGMDTRQVVARFEAERQALAIMDHPNIAKVFDGGATAGGRPYFVMELVKGVPITEFCDQNHLTPRLRLELFVAVCQAVQHAHQKGIIHRDLKPSNVLVTVHDTTPVPKVIDFGVAKALGQELTDKTMFTGFAQMIGTPLYMSPEQAGQSGLDVDTRSDIYSLGVLLYELLTGTTPIDGERFRKAAYDEIRRIIREEEPPRPSIRLTDSKDTLASVSALRRTEPTKLTRLVRGELDWIVMKTLEKDRNRRYETASAFAADVQRYLNDEPVKAFPPSAGYRLRKFARRNRVALATSGLVAAALLSGTVVSVWQAIEATNARQLAVERLENEKTARSDAERLRKLAEAETERAGVAEKRATTEAAIAKAVNDFLQKDLLNQVASAPRDQDIGADVYLTVKEALDRAAARIGQRFQDQPLVEAAIRTTIGAAYGNLFECQLALPHLEVAVKLRRAHLGPDHPDTLYSMDHLAGAYTTVGQHSDAIAISEYMLASRQAQFDPDDPKTLGCLGGLANVYFRAGELDKSRRLFEQLLEKRRRTMGPTHPDTLSTMKQLAQNYEEEGRLDDSIALHEKVVQLRKTVFGSEQEPLHQLEMGSLARVYQRAGRLDEAERLLREILEVCRKRDNNPRGKIDTADITGSLGRGLLLQHKFDEAEPLIREAVMRHGKYRPNDGKYFYWMSLLGETLLGLHKYEEAEPLLLKGYEGLKRVEYGRRYVAEAGERVVRFYEITNHPEKARAWRDRLASAKTSQ